MSTKFDRVGWHVILRSEEEMAERLPECPIRVRMNSDPRLPGGGSAQHDIFMTTEYLSDLLAQGRAVQLSHAQRERKRALRDFAEAEAADVAVRTPAEAGSDVALLARLRQALVDFEPSGTTSMGAPAQHGPRPTTCTRGQVRPALPRRPVH